jgi:uncharacterized protein YegL
MNPFDRVHIVFLLDRSGSMETLREAAVAGLNEFLAHQRRLAPDATATVVLFAEFAQTVCMNTPLSEAHLELSDYVPGGRTALLDAVGSTIDLVGLRIQRLAPHDRPGRVLFAILTDGEENASRGYSALDVQWRVRRQSEIYGWEFLFLGAPDSWSDQARELGIALEDALPFCHTEDGIRIAMADAARTFAQQLGWRA